MNECARESNVFLFQCRSDGDASSVSVSTWSDIFMFDFYKKSGAVDLVCE